MDDSKVHWERIYKTKTPQEVSWTENEPNMSLELISKAKLSLDAQIIDVGGGDSQLVDRLIDGVQLKYAPKKTNALKE